MTEQERKVVEWLIQNQNLSRTQAEEAMQGLRSEIDISLIDPNSEKQAGSVATAYQKWERENRPEWKTARDEEAEARAKAQREAERAAAATGEAPADLEFDGGNPDVMPGFSSFRRRFNTGLALEENPQTAAMIDARVEQMKESGLHEGKPESQLRSEAAEAFGQSSDIVYTPLGEREQYRRAPSFTDEEVYRLQQEDPERYREIMNHARDLGIMREFGPDYSAVMNAAGVTSRRGPQIFRRYQQMVNAQGQKSREEREQDLRETASQLASGMSDWSEILPNLGMMQGSPEADAFITDLAGYQAQEWKIDMGGDQTYTGSTGGSRAPRPVTEEEMFMSRLAFDQMTITEAKSAFSSFSEEELTQIQLLMMDMGLYKDKGAPTLGLLRPGMDDAAFTQFINLIQVNQGVDPRELVTKMIDSNWENALRDGTLAGSTGDLDGDGIPDNIIKTTSRDVLGATVDSTVERLTGRRVVDETFRNDLINEAQKKEQNYLRALNGSFIQNRLSSGGGGVEDVDLFLAAVSGQESGGDYGALNPTSGASGRYQFMPATWRNWSRRAGLGQNAAMTPENQDRTARAMASYYYSQFGNWYDAAIAWYGGPGAVSKAFKHDTPQANNHPSMRQYGEQVMGRMQEIQSSDLAAMTSQGNFGVTYSPDGLTFIEDYDRDTHIEEMARARDRVGTQSWEYHNRGREFIGMLGSTV